MARYRGRPITISATDPDYPVLDAFHSLSTLRHVGIRTAEDVIHERVEDIFILAKIFAPKKTGDLVESAYVNKDEFMAEVVFNASVARRSGEFFYGHYHEANFPADQYDNPTTPGTYPHYLSIAVDTIERERGTVHDEIIKRINAERGYL